MIDFIEGIKNFALAASAVMSVYFPAVAQNIDLPKPSLMPENIITRSGQYTYSGQTLKFIVNIPKSGGEVSGKFNGVCSGPITGHYNSGPAQSIEGKASATCLILLNKKLSVNYIAHLNLEKGKAYIDWTGNLPYTPGKGSFTFDFEPVK